MNRSPAEQSALLMRSIIFSENELAPAVLPGSNLAVGTDACGFNDRLPAGNLGLKHGLQRGWRSIGGR